VIKYVLFLFIPSSLDAISENFGEKKRGTWKKKKKKGQSKGVHFVSCLSNNNHSNASQYGWLRHDTQCNCSNIRQSGHGLSFPWIVIAQISAKVAMVSRFLGYVQDPVTWTLTHLIQLQHEFKELLENYNCDIQEFITVQDPPAPPSKIHHL
jgi:hypothetical protein